MVYQRVQSNTTSPGCVSRKHFPSLKCGSLILRNRVTGGRRGETGYLRASNVLSQPRGRPWSFPAYTELSLHVPLAPSEEQSGVLPSLLRMGSSLHLCK